MAVDVLKLLGIPTALAFLYGADPQAIIAIVTALVVGYLAMRSKVLSFVREERNELVRRNDRLVAQNAELQAQVAELASRPDLTRHAELLQTMNDSLVAHDARAKEAWEAHYKAFGELLENLRDISSVLTHPEK